jgi:transcriptional antiterminator RfaH
MALNWYVLRTEPRAEYLAADALDREGLEVYLPLDRGPYSRPGRPDAPLFPGYLFLRCDPDTDGWPSFRGIHRVAGWINFGGQVHVIPDQDLSELARRVDMMNHQGGLWRRFQPGERVRIVSKTLETLAEVVEEPKSSRAKVRVLFEFMGRLVSGQIPWENVRPIEESPREMQRAPRRTRGKGRWVNGFGPRLAQSG